MEKELTQAVPASTAKPITVKFTEMGGNLDKVQVPMGTTLHDALRQAPNFRNVLAQVDAGKAVNFKVKNKPASLSQALEDGDTVMVVSQVKGG